MKKCIAFALAMICVLSLVGCSNKEANKEATVWGWAQGLNQKDITSATPWSQGKTFEALNSAERRELVRLLNKLTKDSFTENENLTGGAKVCLDQQDAYYTSPAFVGSSDARDAVGLLLQSALVDSNTDTNAVLDKVFKEALTSCREGM